MDDHPVNRLTRRRQLLIVPAIVTVAAIGAWLLVGKESRRAASQQLETAGHGGTSQDSFTPTAAQWATLTIEPVTKLVFRAEHVTEGKIAVDEDRATIVTSLYSGRIMRLLAKAGDTVARGQLLFT